jgi:hypothetical protein
VDRQAFVLVQLQAQVFVAGKRCTIMESYEFPGQRPSPVLGPLTALPVDLPLLHGGRPKGIQNFTFKAVAGPPGTKAIGDLAFAYNVAQSLNVRPSEDARSRLLGDFAKSLASEPLLEVTLKTVDREVTQLWLAGLPWPAYCENGATVARLVRWTPSENQPPEDTEVR